jgi:hypothetical protein
MKFVMKTKWMHHLSLIYFANQKKHVSGMFIANHQEVFTVYVQKLVRVICLGDWLLTGSSILTRSAASQLKRVKRTDRSKIE